MVNPGKVLKRRGSKRTTLHDKHKIEKKVREHHRKTRKDMKKNPQKYKKKDPGIPNSWPFKAQLLKQQEEQREAAKEALKAAREAKVLERQRARQADQALQAAARMTSQQRRELKRKKASCAPPHDVLADADVVLIALDARDPSACRSAALEQALLECGKLPVLALTKCDLVPRACVDGWIAELGARLPTLAFRCPPPELLPPPSAAAGASSKQPVKNYSRAAKLTAGAAAKQDRKAAKAAKAAAAQPTGGYAKHGPVDAAAAAASPTTKALIALLEARRASLAAATDGEAPSALSLGIIGFDRVGKRALHGF